MAGTTLRRSALSDTGWKPVPQGQGKIRALSLWPIWASLVASGQKTIEVRSWRTRYRGPLLICASQRPAYDGLPAGVAVCTVDLVACRRMVREDEARAGVEYSAGAWAWELENVREIERFPVKGQLGLFSVKMPRAFAKHG